VTGRDAPALMGALVTLRPLTLDDVPVLLDQGPLARASVADRADETERLRARVARPTTLDDDGFLSLAVEHEQTMVGDIQARAPRNGFPPGVCEIGLTLRPEVRGRRLGTEAVRLLTDHLHASGWPRVQASTAVGNEAMRRVLERNGYALEGTMRSFAPDEVGGRADYVMYASVRASRG
jgi:RimJ/RimL family protein N-acetyltransferase